MPARRGVVTLQRRHFALIASILAELQADAFTMADGRSAVDLEYLRLRFAERLATTSPAFVRTVFLQAAKGESR